MRTIKLIIIFSVVAASLLAIFGWADLQSQKRYARKMDAPKLVQPHHLAVIQTANHGNVSGQKLKSSNL